MKNARNFHSGSIKTPMLFLWGFSGAGKSSMLLRLKKNNRNGVKLVDLDKKILLSTPYSSMTSLIKKEGMEAFRSLEMKYIEFFCTINDGEKYIIALGAGALNESSIELINSFGKSFWLATPLSECLKHILRSQDRPLVKKGEDYLIKLYHQRLPLYRQASFILDIHAQSRIQTPDDLWNWTE